MKFAIAALSTMMLTTLGSSSSTFSESWSAGQKEEWIWEKIYAQKGTQAKALFPFKTLTIFGTDMHLPFADTDFMQKLFGVPFTRPKTIHIEGITQEIEFVAEQGSEGYTGIFQSGAKHGLARYSVATPYKLGDESSKIVPAAAFKLFRDGKTSANTISMVKFDGLDSGNFFEQAFTTHVPQLDKFPFTVLTKKFSSATDYCFSLGLKDWGMMNEAGQEASHPVFPFMLKFDPQVSIPTQRQGKYFNDHISEHLYKPGQVLFKVYAWKEGAHHHAGQDPVYIGKIVSRTAAIKSAYADSKVMFSHNYYEEDIAAKPEWEQYVEKCGHKNDKHSKNLQVLTSKCPFGFDQLY